MKTRPEYDRCSMLTDQARSIIIRLEERLSFNEKRTYKIHKKKWLEYLEEERLKDKEIRAELEKLMVEVRVMAAPFKERKEEELADEAMEKKKRIAIWKADEGNNIFDFDITTRPGRSNPT